MKQFNSYSDSARKYETEFSRAKEAFTCYIHEVEQVRDMDDEAWEAENFVELDPRALAWLLGIDA